MVKQSIFKYCNITKRLKWGDCHFLGMENVRQAALKQFTSRNLLEYYTGRKVI